MAHKKIIDSVKKQGQVTIKDLDEFLRFVINEYDMRTLNNNYGTWCAEHGYLTFIPEYTPVPETNLFGQLGDLLKAFVVIHRCAERYGADMSRMYLVGDGAGAALACLVYALLWNPVSMQHLEDELPFDVPQEAKLSFKGVCLQNGILDLSSRKMNAIAPYLIEKDWKKTSYAECLSPKTYAKIIDSYRTV